MRTAVAVLLLLGAGAAAAQSPVAQARAHTKALELDRAAAALKRCEAASELSYAEGLEFYELSGVVAALRGDGAGARRAFTELLVLAPSFKLQGHRPPKVTTPFAEAKATARERGPVNVTVEIDATEGAFVTSLRLSATPAALGVATRLKVELIEDGVARTVYVEASAQRVAARGRSVSARVVALGPRDWVRFESETTVFAGPAVVEVAAAPVPAPMAAIPVAQVNPSAPRFRPLAWTLVGFGAVALASGIVMGVKSHDARTALDNPPQEGAIVVGLTRPQALALNQQVVTFAVIADALFIGAGVLGAGALVTWLLGNRVEPTPSLVITPGGLAAAVGGGW